MEEYPIPLLTILMSDIFPLIITGLKSAPDPEESSIIKSGIE